MTVKHSEFWRSVDEVWGSAYGRSLVADLVLHAYGVTAAAALEAGHSPRDVWHALADEMDLTHSQRWVYREDPKKR